jgi:16S rRNA processing protein RimM
VNAGERSDRIVLGRILGPHGIRGRVKVESFTDPPDGLLRYERWFLRSAQGGSAAYRVADVLPDGKRFRVALEGVADRDAATALRGCEIEVERTELPPVGEREHYRDDLLGFAVRNESGALLGKVSRFVDAPGGTKLVVVGTKEYWVPATAPYLRRVLLEQRELLVDWPEDL